MKTNLLIVIIFLLNSLTLNAQVWVCTGATKTYWVDPLDSVAFEWSLQNNCGKIVDGQGSNKISVLWNKESCADSVLLKATGINLCNTNQVGLYIQTSALLKANISGSQTVCMHRSSPVDPITIRFIGKPPFSFIYSDGLQDSTISKFDQTVFQFQPQLPILQTITYRLKQASDSTNCSADSLQTEVVVKVDPKMGAQLQLLTRDTVICPTTPHIAIEMNMKGVSPFTIEYQIGEERDASITEKNELILPFALSEAHTVFHITSIQDQNGCITPTPEAITIDIEEALQHQFITRKKE